MRHPDLVILASFILASVILASVSLALRLEVSKSPGAGMPEAQRLYLLKLVPRILIQTCCLSTSSILARVSIYKNNVRRRGAGGYNFPAVTVSAGIGREGYGKEFQVTPKDATEPNTSILARC